MVLDELLNFLSFGFFAQFGMNIHYFIGFILWGINAYGALGIVKYSTNGYHFLLFLKIVNCSRLAGGEGKPHIKGDEDIDKRNDAWHGVMDG